MLPCMNCKKDVPQEDIRFFAECYVCPDCFRLASRIFDQGQLELQQLLDTLRELIRSSIVQGRLSLSATSEESLAQSSKVSQPRAVDFIVEMFKCQPPFQRTHSPVSSKPPAATPDADGELNSDSTPEPSE